LTGGNELSKDPWKYEVVITDSAFADGNVEQETLSRVGANVKKYQTYDQNDIAKITQTADAILCDGAPINRTIISGLEHARVIVEYGVGYDNVDVKAAMALILSLARRVTWADSFIKAGRWNEYGAFSWSRLMPLSHLDGKTAGIVGFGRIGRQVAERLQAFRMKVLAFDPYVAQNAAAKVGVDLVDLSVLMRQSDIISVNCLLSKETFHLIGKRELDLMRQTALIVNTARGKVIDQVALVNALKSKRIAGAGLDVLEKEPCDPDDPVLSLENVIITPHVAAVSDKATLALRRLASEEVARVLQGEPPKHPVTPLST
jgi:D-3-phosphoglycerate dehydrogenase